MAVIIGRWSLCEGSRLVNFDRYDSYSSLQIFLEVGLELQLVDLLRDCPRGLHVTSNFDFLPSRSYSTNSSCLI